MLKEIKDWMQEHTYEEIDKFRGKMSYSKIKNPSVWERSQFMRYFSKID